MSATPPIDAPAASSTPRILRNTSYLVGAQLLVAPLSMFVNAVAARSLGAANFGILYQAMTFASFAFLFVEWGQPALLTGSVATQRERAGELLGSGLAFRLMASALVIVLLPLLALAAGRDGDFLIVLLLASALGVLGTVAGACQDVFRGYERTDFAALSMVGWQVLSAAVVIPTLLAGGGLLDMLAAQAACAALGAGFVLWMVPRMGVPPLRVRAATIRELWQRGHPFFIFALVLALQPMVEALMLSWFASEEEMGWFAVSRKLVAVLAFPSSALLASLYPTLCRLRTESDAAFRGTAGEALVIITMVAVPLALGCLLYPGIGVAIFGGESFGPAEDNLRVLAPWLLLAYLSVVVGSTLTASGLQRPWTLALLGGVLTGAVLNAPLIHWFQQHGGNGGTGVCVAALVGEVVTLAFAVRLLPRGLIANIERSRWVPPLAGGVAMVAAALATLRLPPLAGATCAGLAYLAALHFTGGLRWLRLRILPGARQD